MNFQAVSAQLFALGFGVFAIAGCSAATADDLDSTESEVRAPKSSRRSRHHLRERVP